MQDFVIWLYAGFLAGVVSRMSKEPAYATLFVFPLLLAVGERPEVVALGFTVATATSGVLNLIYQRRAEGGVVLHFEFLKSLPVLGGVVAGVVVWLMAPWEAIRYVVAAALFITGVRLLFHAGRLALRGSARHILNFFTGFLDTLMGTAASFALMRVLVADIEALLPLFRVVEATASVALKQKIILGGFLAGVGAFAGQNLAQCVKSPPLRYVISIAMVGTGLYVALAS